MSSLSLTRKAVVRQAWPVLISQASMPLVGLVDTAIIGRTGDASALAGVALGAAIMNFVFWSFGFLRMGVTGLTAQAFGAAEKDETQAIILRASMLGACIGVALALLQFPILNIAFTFVDASQAATGHADAYSHARFFGAPALLAGYAINGWLLGIGRTGWALFLQVVTNGANILFNIWFVLGMSLGPAGVGYGTALAEWCAAITGMVICFTIIRNEGGWTSNAKSLSLLLDRQRLKRMFAVNADIMIRTIALLAMFTWFARSGARAGDAQLAANHVLLQMLSVSAYVLDAFAVTAENRIGSAIGARSPQRFWRAVRLTSEFSLGGALLFGLLIWLGGAFFINLVATDELIRTTALDYLLFAAFAPIIGFASWQLDGVFIGATRSDAMRNAAIISLLLYVSVDLILRNYGNTGVWIAFLSSYVFRAVTLGFYIPDLIKGLRQPHH